MAKINPADDQDARQVIIDAVIGALKEKEFTTAVRGPFMTNVMMLDGNYKSKAVQPHEELMFKGIRSGARSAFIFEFEPIGMSEYKQVEFEEKKIFIAMPQFEQTLVNALGYYDDMTWAQAKTKFISERRAQLEVEKEILREEERKSNELDPEWGMF
jgi:hypothetical protein